MAVESGHERFGGLSCGSCGDKLKRLRGCRKPGYNMKGRTAYRFVSPYIVNDKRKNSGMMEECPIGYLIRESPWVFRVLFMVNSMGENPGTGILSLPNWFLDAMSVIKSEQNRMLDAKIRDAKTSEHGRIGDAVRRQSG